MCTDAGATTFEGLTARIVESNVQLTTSRRFALHQAGSLRATLVATNPANVRSNQLERANMDAVVRVLVVDDFERWRVVVRAMLAKIPGLHVIAEASDGKEAVETALDLQPDLIVLDIGLPYLNGIEVVRKVRRFCPYCKILRRAL